MPWSFSWTASSFSFPPSPLSLRPSNPDTMPFIRPYATPTFHSNHLAQVQTTASASARRLPVIDIDLGVLQRHRRAPSRADSVSTPHIYLFHASILIQHPGFQRNFNLFDASRRYRKSRFTEGVLHRANNHTGSPNARLS